MSRSFKNRKDPNAVHITWCGKSNKKDKRIANRKFRRKENVETRQSMINQEDMFNTKDLKDVSNTYDFSSDGLAHYFNFKDWEVEDKHRFKNK